MIEIAIVIILLVLLFISAVTGIRISCLLGLHRYTKVGKRMGMYTRKGTIHSCERDVRVCAYCSKTKVGDWNG